MSDRVQRALVAARGRGGGAPADELEEAVASSNLLFALINAPLLAIPATAFALARELLAGMGAALEVLAALALGACAVGQLAGACSWLLPPGVLAALHAAAAGAARGGWVTLWVTRMVCRVVGAVALAGSLIAWCLSSKRRGGAAKKTAGNADTDARAAEDDSSQAKS